MRYSDGDVKQCPFYKSNSKLNINCEGVEETSKITVKFETLGERKKWAKKYCSSMDYINCPYAKAAEKKYK